SFETGFHPFRSLRDPARGRAHRDAAETPVEGCAGGPPGGQPRAGAGDEGGCCPASSDPPFAVPPFPFGTLRYRFSNLSTRPAESISFCFPVKNGWHLLQISS